MYNYSVDKERSRRRQRVNPINPFILDLDRRETYRVKLKRETELEPGVPKTFRGPGKLMELIENQIVGIGVVVRITHGGSVHLFYRVEENGLLRNVHDPESTETIKQALGKKYGVFSPWFVEEAFFPGYGKDK